MKAFFQHFMFEFRTGIRNKQLLMMNYLFPLAFFLMMGFVMPAINPPFKEILLPAMVTFTIIFSALMGIPDSLVSSREKGIFRSYKINGIPSISILVIPIISSILHMLIVTGIITLFSAFVFKAPMPTNWLNYFLMVLTGSLAASTLAVLIGVVSPNTRLTVMYSQVIFIPSMLVGGVMMPYSVLPQSVGMFAKFFPTTHIMNIFNSLAMGLKADFSPAASIVTLLAGAAIAFLLSILLFSWDSNNSTRKAHPALAALVFLPYILFILII